VRAAPPPRRHGPSHQGHKLAVRPRCGPGQPGHAARKGGAPWERRQAAGRLRTDLGTERESSRITSAADHPAYRGGPKGRVNWQFVVSVKRTDTGGEFTSSAATGHPDDRQEARTIITVSPPASADREQTANPEFATGVRTMTGHPGSVRQLWHPHGKADKMIAGRENGLIGCSERQLCADQHAGPEPFAPA